MTLTGGLILTNIIFLILWFADVIDWSLWLIFAPGIIALFFIILVVIAEVVFDD